MTDIKYSEVYPGVWRVVCGRESANPASRFHDVKPAELPAELTGAGKPFDFEKISFSISRRGIQVVIPVDGDEDFYGLGLQLRSFRQTGKKKTLRVNSDPVNDLGDSHAPVPFLLSTAGYGILADTTRYATFYCASHIPGAGKSGLFATADGTVTDNDKELYAAKNAGVSRPLVIDIQGEEGVSLLIFAGNSMMNALQRYNLYSGGGAMPPLWGLGVCYRGYAGCNAAEVEELAENIRKQHIPCDCFGIEPGWQSKAYSCSFLWDKTRFPEPDKTVSALKNAGYRINLWEHVFTHPSAPFYKEMLPYAGSFDVWEGLVPDLTISEAMDIYSDYHFNNFVAGGIDAFKIDECDNSDYIVSPWSFPECSDFPSGLTGEEMHSIFGMQCMRTMQKAFAKTGKRTWNNVRNAHAFAAPYPFVLYSDLYEIKDFIRGLANAAFAGLLWTPEVRQCESDEDFVRRLQLTVFSPMALVNCWMIKNPPWMQVDVEKNNQGIFAESAPELTRITRKFAELRMALLPYLYTAFARYHLQGIPPVRPLVLDYASDPALRDVEDEFMVGDNLLFVPVLPGEKEKKIIFPQGEWLHYASRERFTGGESTIPCALEDIMLFVRSGAVIPFAKPVESISMTESLVIVPEVYGTDNGSAMLYDGDPEAAVPEADAWLECTVAVDGTVMLSRKSSLFIC